MDNILTRRLDAVRGWLRKKYLGVLAVPLSLVVESIVVRMARDCLNCSDGL